MLSVKKKKKKKKTRERERERERETERERERERKKALQLKSFTVVFNKSDCSSSSQPNSKDFLLDMHSTPSQPCKSSQYRLAASFTVVNRELYSVSKLSFLFFLSSKLFILAA